METQKEKIIIYHDNPFSVLKYLLNENGELDWSRLLGATIRPYREGTHTTTKLPLDRPQVE